MKRTRDVLLALAVGLPVLVSSFSCGGGSRRRPDLLVVVRHRYIEQQSFVLHSSLLVGHQWHQTGPLTMVASDQRSTSSSDTDEDSSSDVDPNASMSVADATEALRQFDSAQQEFMQADGMRGMGGGTSALSYVQTTLSPSERQRIKNAVQTLVRRAHAERGAAGNTSGAGRIMLGICAENAPEALGGLRSWVDALSLPRGMLHGMDVDGVPIPPEDLGCVYVKFSTGGAMTFKQMRDSKQGFDALWRPGDALLEPYDGAFRGVYLNVELSDGEFRQFGVLPTDLFMELDVDDDW
mmetsp:Transcript_29791/g.64503  ORF Transcript_29791/g.64503 Transcript_29791/m.64503 type:complete len:295 (+) Transcript_29791:195-1079(+)